MNIVLLGKTLKAMYKLSGKTLTQLSDETDLTVDTINNLFYARVQKPGIAGVNALVNSMGFSIQQLMAFLEDNPGISENSDVTELFTKYISASEDTISTVPPANDPAVGTKSHIPTEIEILNADHEKQLDRFHAAHQRYVEQLKDQQSVQIEQMKAHNQQMEHHFDHSVAELRTIHAREIERLEKENDRLHRITRVLGIAVGVETILVLLLFILDMIDRGIGWMR